MADNYDSVMLDLFAAMDTIAAKNVEQVQFNKTVTCKITDNSNKEQGEYTVTDGSSTFKAYSENTTYNEGISVYVTIPNGDYNKQKIIVGKYMSDNDEYYTYTPPLDSYVDITQNIIESLNKDEFGLVANGTTRQIVLWDKDFSNGKGYDRLGVRASFKSWLGSQNVIEGSYGIAVYITSEESNTTSTTANKYYCYKIDSSDMYGNPYGYEAYYEQEQVFDVSEIENIVHITVTFYQNQDFYNSSKEYLAHGYTLNDIFYENDPNLFISEPYISLGLDLNDFTEDVVRLYTLDSEKYAAYLTDEVKAQLLNEDNTLDLNLTDVYNTALNKVNTKKLQARWVHKDSESGDIYAIDETDEIPEGCVVHWYKYNLSQGVTDILAGAFWEEIEEMKNKFIYENYVPNPKNQFEIFKVIIEDLSEDYVQTELIYNDTDIMKINQEIDDALAADENADVSSLETERDELMQSYLDKINYHYSELLELDNEHTVASQATVDLIQGLTIECDVDESSLTDADGNAVTSKKGYNGIYRIYDDAGQIMSSAEASKKRILSAKYTSIVTGLDKLDTAEKITWKIPLENTMIYTPTEGTEFVTKKENEDDIVDEVSYTANPGYVTISRYGVMSSRVPGDEEADSSEQYFRIKSYYAESAVNNTVYCTVTKNNVEYNAEFTMMFGPCGTNGTDYTFTIEFDNKVPALTAGEAIKVVPHIFDYQNKEVTEEMLDKAKISYSWYSEGTGALSIGNVASDGSVMININSTVTENKTTRATTFSDYMYYILQAKLKDAVTITTSNGTAEDSDDSVIDEVISEAAAKLGTSKELSVSLFAHLPITVRKSKTWTQFDGTSKVAYDSSGVNPKYYKGAYTLYTYNTTTNKTEPDIYVTWAMSYGKDTQDSINHQTNVKYYPQISDDGVLTVPSMYLQENGTQIAVVGTKNGEDQWIQPIYIYQESWASAMLNSWDGSLTFDEENGTILSTMIGAGKKDNQNRFNGVLMGDVSVAGEEETNAAMDDYYSGIGIYGYNEGNKSFGLNISGKAFFGKSGNGQILIDGDEGAIQSQRYYQTRHATDDNKAGMKIDLNAGTLITYGDGNKAMIKIDPSPTTDSKAYFEIKSKAGNDLMFVGTNKYFLQSDNYKPDSYEYVSPSSVNSSNYTNYYYENSSGKIVKVQSTDTYSSDIEYYQAKQQYGSGIKIDLMRSRIDAYDFTLKATNASGQYAGSYIQMSSDGSPFFKIHYEDTGKVKYKRVTASSVSASNYRNYYVRNPDAEDGYSQASSYDSSGDTAYYEKQNAVKVTGKDLIAITNSQYIICSQNWDNSAKTGLKFNLASGSLTAYEFSIRASGDYEVTENGTKVTKSGTIVMDSSAGVYPLKIGDWFKVKWNGEVYCTYLEANTGGKIGPFTISNSAIYTGSSTWGGSGVYLGSDGFSINSGGFKVDSSGNVSATGNMILDGSFTARGNINLNGVISGNSWSVTSGGLATFSNINATGGKVGGWTISGSTLTGGAITLNSGGSITGSGWSIDGGGLAKFDNIQISGDASTIGGKVIDWEYHKFCTQLPHYHFSWTKVQTSGLYMVESYSSFTIAGETYKIPTSYRAINRNLIANWDMEVTQKGHFGKAEFLTGTIEDGGDDDTASTSSS